MKNYRTRHDLTQADLARLLHLDQSYISRLERGLRNVGSIKELRYIAEKLAIPPTEVGLAVADTDQTPGFDPQHTLSSIRVARARRTRGEPTHAQRDLRLIGKSLPSRSDDPHIRQLLAEFELARSLVLTELLPDEQLHQAATAVRRAWDLVGHETIDAPGVYLLSNLGNQLRRAGQVAISIPILERALQESSEPNDVVGTALILAKATSSQGQTPHFRNAIRTARDALQHCDPGNALVSNFALTEVEARGLLSLGLVKPALRAIETRDGSSELLSTPQWRIIFAITRAQALLASGDVEQAAALFIDATRASAIIKLPHQLQRIIRICNTFRISTPALDEVIELARASLRTTGLQ